MPLNPRLYLLPLALAGLTLAAGEDTEKAPVSKRCNTFGVSIQADLPLRDLKDDLDHRTGFGLGLQWTHDHGVHHASRTRPHTLERPVLTAAVATRHRTDADRPETGRPSCGTHSWPLLSYGQVNVHAAWRDAAHDHTACRVRQHHRPIATP